MITVTLVGTGSEEDPKRPASPIPVDATNVIYDWDAGTVTYEA